jgi:hypothetical protein
MSLTESARCFVTFTMKHRIPHESLTTWSGFKDFLAQQIWKDQPPVRGLFMFRGQADAEWALDSLFDRMFSRGSRPHGDLEQRLLENFRKECESESDLEELAGDSERLTALAQHGGLPTRLLDWSDSPYIASFFAFQGYVSQSSRGTVASGNGSCSRNVQPTLKQFVHHSHSA